jgi:nickel/cobalt transporter (NiCoT) family protein
MTATPTYPTTASPTTRDAGSAATSGQARVIASRNSGDRLGVWALFATIALLHVVGFGTLLLIVAPHHYRVDEQIVGFGLGITAYMFGLRHAFDADHIAAIDNTTRKLMADGKKPKAVGFWFAMGHSMMVLILAVLVIAGTHAASTLLDDNSAARSVLGLAGTLASGGFLYLIGIVNVVALVAIWRIFRALRTGKFNEQDLEDRLGSRGVIARILRPVMNRIKRPAQMFPVGVLFGLGFDTASEVALLALSGTGAAAGLPWFAVLTLPVLFAAGMSLLDTAEGLVMTFAYQWALATPVRKVYYNLTITGLSVAVALAIGTIELVTVLHDHLGWVNGVTNWVSAISLNNFGFAIVGLFIVTWLCAIAYWKLAGGERRWQTAQAAAPSN